MSTGKSSVLRKVSQDFETDGKSVFRFQHNLGRMDVLVQVWKSTTNPNGQEVYVIPSVLRIEIPDKNTVIVGTDQMPAGVKMRIVILG